MFDDKNGDRHVAPSSSTPTSLPPAIFVFPWMFDRQNSVFWRERLPLVYHHTPADVAEAVRQLIAGEVPVQRLITARLPMSKLTTALQMVADRTTLRTILVSDHPRRRTTKPEGSSGAAAAIRGRTHFAWARVTAVDFRLTRLARSG